MNPKHLTKALLFTVISCVIKSRQQIWEYLKPYPCWWKILIAVAAACFFTLAFIYATNMEWMLYRILGINTI
jgi:hypothetical protein